MKSHQLHTTEEVALPSLASNPSPIADNVAIGWRGGLAKEVDFTFMLLLLFKQAHFVLFSG